MSFDDIIDRRGIYAANWDAMEKLFGVSPDDGIPMWVADKDFQPPAFLTKAAQDFVNLGHFGYFSGEDEYRQAIAWWMKTRHGWAADPDHMVTTAGLGNAIAMLIHCFTQPGDNVVTFTPVYHEFANKIRATGRQVTELPLVQQDGTYHMDFADYDARMTGREKMVLLCSPHNPAGRIWTQAELAELVAFCDKHDLLIVSDEVHQDLVFAGHKHLPLPVAVPEAEPRLIMLTSASKTFSVAGTRTGAVTIADPKLRETFKAFHHSFNMSPNNFGVAMTRAAYSPEGAEYVDRLCTYIEGNAAFFNGRINAIPGLHAMDMQGTYLAWVDFAGTGMERQEIVDRVYNSAKIAATPGHTLGTGGETFLRFNIATRRSVLDDAATRLERAFADLQ